MAAKLTILQGNWNEKCIQIENSVSSRLHNPELIRLFFHLFLNHMSARRIDNLVLFILKTQMDY